MQPGEIAPLSGVSQIDSADLLRADVEVITMKCMVCCLEMVFIVQWMASFLEWNPMENPIQLRSWNCIGTNGSRVDDFEATARSFLTNCQTASDKRIAVLCNTWLEPQCPEHAAGHPVWPESGQINLVIRAGFITNFI